jgi:putative ABC transport system ATP-binding protein
LGADVVSGTLALDRGGGASEGAHAAASANVAAAQAPAIFRIMSLIIAKQLTQTYTSAGRPLTVLADVDLTIAPESFIAIVGPSGSGKTTLLGLLAGLDRPTAGSVHLHGQDLSALTDDQRARFRAQNVGFVFQTFQLIPTLTALENVMVPIELANVQRAKGAESAEARALQLLQSVGLADRVHHYPAQLSGGEQQRVALARAFANQPKVLFADEPTGNLDAETGRRIIDLLVELNAAARTTLILVTHDLELAALAHRVVRLAGGRVVSDEVAG